MEPLRQVTRIARIVLDLNSAIGPRISKPASSAPVKFLPVVYAVPQHTFNFHIIIDATVATMLAIDHARHYRSPHHSERSGHCRFQW